MWKASSPTQRQVRQSPPGTDSAAASTSTGKTRNPGRRFAHVVRLKRGCVDEYKACHANIWPEVARQIKDCGIVDYSIYYDGGTGLLFGSYKYVGYDYVGDMERMAENPRVREWWKMTDSYQESLVPGAVSSEAGTPSWWKPLEEVFHQA